MSLGEERLIEIVYDYEEQCMDFNIPATGNDIVKNHKQEVINILEKLNQRLKDNEYPFSL